MDKVLLEKIDLIKKLNTDNSRFILKVYESFQKKQIELEQKKYTI